MNTPPTPSTGTQPESETRRVTFTSNDGRTCVVDSWAWERIYNYIERLRATAPSASAPASVTGDLDLAFETFEKSWYEKYREAINDPHLMDRGYLALAALKDGWSEAVRRLRAAGDGQRVKHGE